MIYAGVDFPFHHILSDIFYLIHNSSWLICGYTGQESFDANYTTNNTQKKKASIALQWLCILLHLNVISHVWALIVSFCRISHQ